MSKIIFALLVLGVVLAAVVDAKPWIQGVGRSN